MYIPLIRKIVKMVTCSVKNCGNNSNNAAEGTKFFRFPSEQERRKMWAEFCAREVSWVPNDNNRICSDHFDENQYEQHRRDGFKKLSPKAVPTLNGQDINVYEVFIKQENDCDSLDNLESTEDDILSCGNSISFNNCIVWLDHDYCKPWKDTEHADANFWRNEATRLAAELEMKERELSKAKEVINKLSKQLGKVNTQALTTLVSEF